MLAYPPPVPLVKLLVVEIGHMPVLGQNYRQMVNPTFLVAEMKLLVHDQDFLFLFVLQYVVLLENDLMLLNIVLVNFQLKFFFVSKKRQNKIELSFLSPNLIRFS
jgi:hypothetical protein